MPLTSPRRKRVTFLVESSNAYGRGLLRGLSTYLRAHGSWSVQIPEMGRGGPVPEWLADWEGHGIIARIENEAIAEAVSAKGLPTVDVSAARLLPDLPWIEVDESEVARAAADHLCGRGFEHLAFCGDQRFRWSALRGRAFEEQASGRARSLALYHAPPTKDRLEALADWLVSLPRPLGVFACFDHVGRQLLDACRIAGLLVPEQIAVLGADDDELLCDLSDPPLSSIALNAHGAGFAAAELLARLMHGEHAEPEGRFIPPLGVVQRRSTDILAIEDPALARALHFIHHHACDGIRVADVLRAAAVSRRVLESRFKARLGRSPNQEILRARIERIRTMLLETDLTIAEIAHRTGFEHIEYMTVSFKRAMGCTPTAFRKQSS